MAPALLDTLDLLEPLELAAEDLLGDRGCSERQALSPPGRASENWAELAAVEPCIEACGPDTATLTCSRPSDCAAGMRDLAQRTRAESMPRGLICRDCDLRPSK